MQRVSTGNLYKHAYQMLLCSTVGKLKNALGGESKPGNVMQLPMDY